MRIDHLDPRRPQLVGFRLAMENQPLAGLQTTFEITAMKEFAGQLAACLILHQQVVDGIAAPAHRSNRLAAQNARANRVGSARLDVLHFREVDAVFVTEGQVAEQIFQRVDAALGEQLGALWTYASDHAHFAAEIHSHGLLFISLPPQRCGRGETCATILRIDRVRVSPC